MSEDAAPGEPLPLAGIRVLDVGSFIAAPAAATAMGDWGADVIKVEPPGAGDPYRVNWKNPNYPQAKVNFPWAMDGRNKRSIALDLKHPDGRAALDRLIAGADVMIVNFPKPARERLRLDWPQVEPVNPRLIYASLTGYGETGPEAATPGFDNNAYFARAGILEALGYEGGPPGFSLPAQGDRATAMTLLSAIMIALYRRERTGKGGWVGTSLYANGAWSNAALVAGALVGATRCPAPPRERPRSALLNPYRAADGRWFTVVVAPEARSWPIFCRAIGRADLLEDPRFAEALPRRQNAAALVAELDRVFAAHPWAHWRAAFVAAGVPAAPINHVSEVVEDEQAEHAGIFLATEAPDVPRTVASPVRLGFATMRKAGRAPELGAHTEAILREAGLDDAAIAALQRSGALG
ncbi:CaiB/BaiF CoA transferase family protein [Desertibaculum subflavum]|uniref:CaiB/BaiF CoA transferase family protein n=1 Tax=Desertibaculum subflavum TaxID=2268458 RepID=UPI000E66CB7D